MHGGATTGLALAPGVVTTILHRLDARRGRGGRHQRRGAGKMRHGLRTRDDEQGAGCHCETEKKLRHMQENSIIREIVLGTFRSHGRAAHTPGFSGYASYPIRRVRMARNRSTMKNTRGRVPANIIRSAEGRDSQLPST